MFIVHVSVHVLPDKIQDFIEASELNARLSRLEEGVLRFDVIQERDRPERFVLVEIYKSPEAASAHKETSHYKTWRDTVADMMAEPRFSTKYVNVFAQE